MILSLFLQFLFFFTPSGSLWECTETTAMGSFLRSKAVVSAEITNYYFKDQHLYLELTIFDKFKDPGDSINHIRYDYPGAFLEYKAGIRWMNSLIGKKYVMYLDQEGEEYVLGICSRRISSTENKVHREIQFLKDLSNSYSFSRLWIDNKELLKEQKASFNTNLDSLVATIGVNMDSLDGYPVVPIQILLDRYGRIISVNNPKLGNVRITEYNDIQIQTHKSGRDYGTIMDFFCLLSCRITNWKPAQISGEPLNSLVTIKWELTPDKQIVYRIM